jgi:uncharacterized protein YdeI (YjbR/CyaY-like superfamily)
MKNQKTDFFFNKPSKWQEEYNLLRTIALECKLTEELKWGCPCYTLQNKNIFLIHGFKDYCALLFMKGALIKDLKGILIQQTENVQAARQIRFTNLNEIIKQKSIIKAYIKEAIEIEKAGLKVELKKTAVFKMPEEFQKILETKPAIKKAFLNLSSGRQRAYLLFFSSAKQSKTRELRIEKYLPKIINGKGLND